MKKALTIALVCLLTLALLTACGANDGNSAPTDTPPETPATESAVPEPDSEANEEFDADAWFIDQWWSLSADINQKAEVGELFGLPGMYADYIFTILMVKGPYDEDPAITGRYFFDVDSTILFNSDEAADKLLSEAMGGLNVSGSGLGISVEQIGHYTNDGYFDDDDNFIFVDSGYMQNVKKNWQSVIKDKNGKRVQPEAGSYMMFEEFTIEYTGSGGSLFYGTSGEKTVADVYLFVIVEPDMPGVDIDLTDRHVKVYITFPDWTIKGTEIWLEGEGTLSIHEVMFEINGEN